MGKPLSKLTTYFLILGLFLLLTGVSHSATLMLNNIGALSTGGNAYNEWWYTGENPAFSGVASASASVTVTIDGTSGSTTADGSGNWSYATSTLTTGDHTVSIASGSETYSFTLHTGQAVPSDLGSSGTTTQSTSSVPVTGSDTAIALIITAGLLGAGYYLYKKNNPQRLFEKNAIKD